MKSSKEIRRLNFLEVIATKCAGSQTKAAEALGYSTPSLVSRYLTGSKDIGDGTARKVEEVFALKKFWMDTDHVGKYDTNAMTDVLSVAVEEPEADYNVAAVPPPAQGEVPLISWVQAGAWAEVVDNFAPGDAESWYACPRRHGPHTFALRVRGISMEPKFQDGDIIFVDPDVAAEHGRNVVVRFEDSKEATFKQLIVEGENKFLRALNPDWPGPRLIEINGSATICGVVVGKFVEL